MIAAAEARTGNAQHSKASADWYTPPSIVEPARAVLGGIDLDPASCPAANRMVQARRIFTVQENGLARDWLPTTDSIFLNPPTPPRDWWVKLMTEGGTRRRAIYLAYSVEQIQQSQVWAEKYGVPSMLDRSFSICIPSRRVAFLCTAQDAISKWRAKHRFVTEPTRGALAALKRLEALDPTALVEGDQPPHSSAVIGVNVDRVEFRRAFKALGDCR